MILFVPLFLTASIWKQSDGPYNYLNAYKIFSYNEDLYMASHDENKATFKLSESDQWIKMDTGVFANKGLIQNFKQDENTVIFAADSGIFLSYDYGESWKFIDSLDGSPRLGIVHIFNGEIYYQRHFRKCLSIIDSESDSLVKVYSVEGDTIFADIMVSSDNYIFAVDPLKEYDYQDTIGTLFISSDFGETWHFSNTMKEQISDLIYHNNTLFAFIRNNSLIKSNDYGETWDLVDDETIDVRKVISYNEYLVVISDNIWFSSDGGKSWEARSKGIDRLKFDDIMINDGNLYVHTDYGGLIYKYIDETEEWKSLYAYTDDVNQNSIRVDNDTLFSTGSLFINYSTDNGASWYNYSDSLFQHYIRLAWFNKCDSIIVANPGHGRSLYISNDYGNHWRYENFGTVTLQPQMGEAIIIGDKILVTVRDKGVMISYDAGETFEVFENEFFNSETSIFNEFKIDEDNRILYTNQGVVRTTDKGLTWIIDSTAELSPFHAYTSNDEFQLAVSVDAKEIYQSTNYGLDWENINANIDSDWIIIDILTYNNFLIIVCLDGVRVSDDMGETWASYDSDVYSYENELIEFRMGQIKGDRLVLTSNQGIWYTDLSNLGLLTSTVEKEIERNYIYTYPPYPNPANSQINVLTYWDINLPMKESDISVYNLNGVKLDTKDKINIIKQADYYGIVTWDCSGEQPGIYIVRIAHGTEEKAVKVIVK